MAYNPNRRPHPNRTECDPMTERLLRLLDSLLGLGRPLTRLRTRVAFAGQTLETRAMLSGTPAEVGPADAGGASDSDTTDPDTTDPDCDCPCDETHQPQTDEELPADDESPDDPAADGDPTDDDPDVPPEDEDCDCPFDPEDPANDGTGDDTTGDDTTGGGTGGGGSGGSDSGNGDNANPDDPAGDDGGGTDDGGADDGSGGEDPSGDGPEDDTGDDGTSDDGASDDGTSGDDGGTTGGSGDDSSGNGTGDTGGDDSGSGGPGGSDGDSNPPGDGGADDSGDGGTSDDGVGDTGTGDGGSDTGGSGSDGTGSDGGTGDDGSGGGDSGDTGSDGDTPNGPGDGGPSGDDPTGDDPTGDDPTGDDGNPDDPDDPDDDGPDMPDEPGGPDMPDEPGGPDTDPRDPDGPTDDPGDPGSPEDPGTPDDDPSDDSGNLAPYFDDRVWEFTAGETVFGDGGPALLTGEDPEGQQITFSGGGDTPFRVAANGSVDYADDASTTETEYTFTAEVRDPLGAIGYATVIVTIYQEPGNEGEPGETNYPPRFDEPSYLFVTEEANLSSLGRVSATDPEGQEVTYASVQTTLFRIAHDGVVQPNSPLILPGEYVITAIATDEDGASDYADVTVHVLSARGGRDRFEIDENRDVQEYLSLGRVSKGVSSYIVGSAFGVREDGSAASVLAAAGGWGAYISEGTARTAGEVRVFRSYNFERFSKYKVQYSYRTASGEVRYDGLVEISIRDMNDPPSNIRIVSNEPIVDWSPGAGVFKISADDEDGDSLTYGISLDSARLEDYVSDLTPDWAADYGNLSDRVGGVNGFSANGKGHVVLTNWLIPYLAQNEFDSLRIPFVLTVDDGQEEVESHDSVEFGHSEHLYRMLIQTTISKWRSAGYGVASDLLANFLTRKNGGGQSLYTDLHAEDVEAEVQAAVNARLYQMASLTAEGGAATITQQDIDVWNAQNNGKGQHLSMYIHAFWTHSMWVFGGVRVRIELDDPIEFRLGPVGAMQIVSGGGYSVTVSDTFAFPQGAMYGVNRMSFADYAAGHWLEKRYNYSPFEGLDTWTGLTLR